MRGVCCWREEHSAFAHTACQCRRSLCAPRRHAASGRAGPADGAWTCTPAWGPARRHAAHAAPPAAASVLCSSSSTTSTATSAGQGRCPHWAATRRAPGDVLHATCMTDWFTDSLGAWPPRWASRTSPIVLHCPACPAGLSAWRGEHTGGHVDWGQPGGARARPAGFCRCQAGGFRGRRRAGVTKGGPGCGRQCRGANQ